MHSFSLQFVSVEQGANTAGVKGSIPREAQWGQSRKKSWWAGYSSVFHCNTDDSQTSCFPFLSFGVSTTVFFSQLSNFFTQPFVDQNKLKKMDSRDPEEEGCWPRPNHFPNKPPLSVSVSESYFGFVWPSCISGEISVEEESWLTVPMFVLFLFAGQHASDTTIHGAAEHWRLQQEPVPDQRGGLPRPLLSWQQPGVRVPGGPHSPLGPNCRLLSRCEC